MIIGERHGRLTAVDMITVDGRAHVVCKCTCGNTCTVDYRQFHYGAIKSCGCLAQEIREKFAKKKREQRAKEKRKCLICGSEDYKCRGMCHACYMKLYRKKKKALKKYGQYSARHIEKAKENGGNGF